MLLLLLSIFNCWDKVQHFWIPTSIRGVHPSGNLASVLVFTFSFLPQTLNQAQGCFFSDTFFPLLSKERERRKIVLIVLLNFFGGWSIPYLKIVIICHQLVIVQYVVSAKKKQTFPTSKLLLKNRSYKKREKLFFRTINPLCSRATRRLSCTIICSTKRPFLFYFFWRRC